jgi:hypothetical protein
VPGLNVIQDGRPEIVNFSGSLFGSLATGTNTYGTPTVAEGAGAPLIAGARLAEDSGFEAPLPVLGEVELSKQAVRVNRTSRIGVIEWTARDAARKRLRVGKIGVSQWRNFGEMRPSPGVGQGARH